MECWQRSQERALKNGDIASPVEFAHWLVDAKMFNDKI